MDVPSCLQKDVRLSHGQRWAGALRFNPFAILRGMDRKQSHPSSINVSQRPLGTRETPPGQAAKAAKIRRPTIQNGPRHSRAAAGPGKLIVYEQHFQPQLAARFQKSMRG